MFFITKNCLSNFKLDFLNILNFETGRIGQTVYPISSPRIKIIQFRKKHFEGNFKLHVIVPLTQFEFSESCAGFLFSITHMFSVSEV